MKRLTAILLAAFLCMSVAGCSGSTDSTPQTSEQNSLSDSLSKTEDSRQKADSPEKTDAVNMNMIAIVDREEKQLGQISFNSGATLTNNGIFYAVEEAPPTVSDTIAAGAEGNGKGTVTYHLYDLKTGTDYSFGSIPDQDYEAGYTRTELNGKLYTLVITGNAMDNTPDPLLLAEFDLTAHTLNTYKLSDNGFPYTAMTAAGGKLLLLNHDQTGTLHDRVYSFDPDSKESCEVLQFELADTVGETLRGLYSDGKKLYLLRLRFDGAQPVRLFLDTYDLSYQKLSEKDITSMLREAAGAELAAEDVENEMKQMVSRFLVLDETAVYYENFSTTRFLGNIGDGTLFSETKGLGDLFLASSGSGEPFFYCIFGGTSNENSIFEWKNGALRKTVFKADDDRYYLTGASGNADGERLIRVEYTDPDNSSITLPTKLYFF